MCGRNTVHVRASKIKSRYRLKDEPEFEPSYNVAPGDRQPVIVGEGTKRSESAEWNFIPGWAENRDKWRKRNIINGRSETLHEKKLFRKQADSQRCLVPSTGFYEWKGERGSKQPFHVTWKNSEIVSLAGIFTKTDNGYTFLVVTEEARGKMKEIHDRMPVVLNAETEDEWLDEGSKIQGVERLPSEELEVYPVSQKVNDPSFDRPEAVEQVEGLGSFYS